MKHGMTFARFEANVEELMRLDRGAGKLIVLGRDTAFHDDVEFKSIILGRQVTAGGNEVRTRGRRAFQELRVRDFGLDEARRYVERYFPIAAQEANRGSEFEHDTSWVGHRQQELLSGNFDTLLVRPVHAQMLCQIATDPSITLAMLSKYGLFDRFVHFLLDREVKKRGRDPRFSIDVRRQFNAALALWLWQQGSASTVTLSFVPATLCHRAAAHVSHDYDDVALRRELIAGCLIEKGAGTVFFGHRSLQEFLVADALISTDHSAARSGVDLRLIVVIEDY